MPADPQRVKEVFMAVSDAAASDRPDWLRRECGDDLDLLSRVEALLKAHEAPGSYLNPPTEAHRAHGLAVGHTFAGRYKLREELGEGGMGIVFVADQTEPVQRRVALKVIRTGADSAHVLARFEQERQALALMDHPNIAKVLDAGVSEAGQPYFVMELIKGVPLTKYCDEAKLTPRERLELFIPVCQAVQHAHLKGIIHRDLKPSNILVGLYDGKPVPKVIDFGVAKATGPRISENSVYTEVGSVIGTFEYMSPEQAELNNLDIDTRSDVYALGVILYELLTGTVPFSRRELQSAGFAEMLRVIKEEEPPKPSTRLSGSKELKNVAASRHTEPAKLSKFVRGDLDWITMKALEKDRARRYETANSLAHDIQRFLSDEPVEACPPSAAYRMRKFARKNRAALIAGGLVTLSLLAGTVVSTWQAMVARKAEYAAQQSEAETKAVLDFVENKILAAARPEGQDGGLGNNVTLRRAIEAALPFVETNFTSQPLVEARLRKTIGATFLHLGQSEMARQQLQRALDLSKAKSGLDHPTTLWCMHAVANSLNGLGRHDDALKLHQETLALRRSKLGPDHSETLASMGSVATTLGSLGRHADAIVQFQDLLALMKAKMGGDHSDTLMIMNNMAASYAALDRHEESFKLVQEVVDIRTIKSGPTHPDTLMAKSNLAATYTALGRHADALKLNQETLALLQAKLDPDHPLTLNCMNNLAHCFARLARHAEAAELHEKTLALQKSKFGFDHPNTLFSMTNLAGSYFNLGRYPDAIRFLEEALRLQKDRLGADHPATIYSMNELAWMLATTPDPKLRDPQRAIELATTAAKAVPTRADYWGTLGTARYSAGEWKAAIADLERAIRLRRSDEARHAFNGFVIAMAHSQLGEKDRAREWYDQSVGWMDKGLANDAVLKRLRSEAAELLGVEIRP